MPENQPADLLAKAHRLVIAASNASSVGEALDLMDEARCLAIVDIAESLRRQTGLLAGILERLPAPSKGVTFTSEFTTGEGVTSGKD